MAAAKQNLEREDRLKHLMNEAGSPIQVTAGRSSFSPRSVVAARWV